MKQPNQDEEDILKALHGGELNLMMLTTFEERAKLKFQ